MQFLYPWFLWALLALAIPIIVHLFNFRRYKTVYFSNVNFLREVKEETSSRSKIKHWLSLLARLLALSSIIFAFAQPFIKKNEQNGIASKQLCSIYIDNSFSMRAVNENSDLLSQAKMHAVAIANAQDAETKFQLLTNDLQGKHQRLFSKDAFLQEVSELNISAASRDLQFIKERVTSIQDGDTDIEQYLISDFQESIVNLNDEIEHKLILVPLEVNAINNLYIDSAWLESPVLLKDQQAKLLVRLKNSGNSNVDEARLSLKLNGQVKGIEDFSVAANSYTIDSLNFTIAKSGWNSIELFMDDYPITFDDRYFGSFYVPEKIKVLNIHETENDKYVRSFFNSNAIFEFSSSAISQLNFDALNKQNLIVLNELVGVSSGLSSRLSDFVAAGGRLCILPSKKANIAEYNRLLSGMNLNEITASVDQAAVVRSLNAKSELFNQVFQQLPSNPSLPKTQQHFSFSDKSRVNVDVVMRFADGSPYLQAYPFGSGKVFLFASGISPKASDLGLHNLFAPLMFKMSVVGASDEILAYYIDEPSITLNGLTNLTGDKVYLLNNDQNNFIPQQQKRLASLVLNLQGQAKDAGFYKLKLEGAEQIEALLALNYNRAESNTNRLSAAVLKERYKHDDIEVIEKPSVNLSAAMQREKQGRQLWKVCLIFALVFLLFETIFLRLLP